MVSQFASRAYELNIASLPVSLFQVILRAILPCGLLDKCWLGCLDRITDYLARLKNANGFAIRSIVYVAGLENVSAYIDMFKDGFAIRTMDYIARMKKMDGLFYKTGKRID